ncbi:uncharacterized protein Z518_05157 [Rhinocladiella mackenziei CBS 650.93]|uniref:Uncharacterized protein n=1 Tax=Rhinocladiella mackenziei CBS 650.93 TaxID=1442369 RepID=A0A0D2J5H2_9EURO|nr:uncharacterized protein Z518_05157 [Rhinocladiella mackenziei CBS 650.93]KIX04290.1 hypothetical protein Z518_05157 [Rhinocladiella mackenziei CBS 650.93]
MNVNTAIARKAVPGSEEAYTVYQLCERNNTNALSQKFASDLAQTATAMKETTITAARFATGQARMVGSSLVSRKKLGKASRRIAMHTGALSMKTGHAVKGQISAIKGCHLLPLYGYAQPPIPTEAHADDSSQQHSDRFRSQSLTPNNQTLSQPTPSVQGPAADDLTNQATAAPRPTVNPPLFEINLLDPIPIHPYYRMRVSLYLQALDSNQIH